MATPHSCLSLFLLSTWVALLLQPLQGAWGAPLEPVYPGDYATPEQMAQYATQLRRYINTQTRPSGLGPCAVGRAVSKGRIQGR
ncbi:Ppy [Phodopus roborovskii]|uniref:Ppy protein n=1 Tax=Phodopus roborovskii TaxID=109678 RepID=A0AAU9YLU6_PHORO|nr:Ppy [Phodopus roborovskii]